MQIIDHADIMFEYVYSSIKESMTSICTEDEFSFIWKMVGKPKQVLKPICMLPYWFFSCFEGRKIGHVGDDLYRICKLRLESYIADKIFELMSQENVEKRYISASIDIARYFSHSITRRIAKNQQKSEKDFNDIHDYFKHMADNLYAKSNCILETVQSISALLNLHSSHPHYQEINGFFQHYANAKLLEESDQSMCKDYVDGIKTPATVLMRAQYSSDYIHSMIRARIDMHLRLAHECLRNIANFDYEKFIDMI